MKRTSLAICAAMVFIACNSDKKPVADTTVAAATTTTPSEPAPDPMPDSATMMKNWMAYATPGAEHKMLAESNGKWDGEVTMWMAAGAPPSVSKMTTENKMIMGGRYQQSINKGSFDGMPFEGISTVSYDNGKKLWTSTWIDNMGTGIMIMEGNWDEATKTMTLKGKCFDPTVMKDKECRETFTMVDKDHQIMQMYETLPDGKERKTMQIHYTRKK
jgi:hypothetical protein